MNKPSLKINKKIISFLPEKVGDNQFVKNLFYKIKT